MNPLSTSLISSCLSAASIAMAQDPRAAQEEFDLVSFYVTAVYPGGESVPSNVVTISNQPLPVALEWTAPMDAAPSSYRLYAFSGSETNVYELGNEFRTKWPALAPAMIEVVRLVATMTRTNMAGQTFAFALCCSTDLVNWRVVKDSTATITRTYHAP